MPIETKALGPRDMPVLDSVAPGVFDHPVDTEAARAFLADPRHHIVVAVDHGTVVGFVSAVHYVHPDKPRPELWVNEIQVAPTHRRRGLARVLLDKVLALGRERHCAEAWVLTDVGNTAARRLYSSLGGVEGSQDALMFTFQLDQ